MALYNDDMSSNWLIEEGIENSDWLIKYAHSLYFALITMCTIVKTINILLKLF